MSDKAIRLCQALHNCTAAVEEALENLLRTCVDSDLCSSTFDSFDAVMELANALGEYCDAQKLRDAALRAHTACVTYDEFAAVHQGTGKNS
jgi:hypothetical protein